LKVKCKEKLTSEMLFLPSVVFTVVSHRIKDIKYIFFGREIGVKLF